MQQQDAITIHVEDAAPCSSPAVQSTNGLGTSAGVVSTSLGNNLSIGGQTVPA
jgi:hypothetical protein